MLALSNNKSHYFLPGLYEGDVKSQGAVPYYDTPNAEFREVDGFR